MLNFNKQRYDKIAGDFELWWEHKLDRPLIQVTLTRAAAGDYGSSDYRREILNACYNLEMPVCEAMERIEEAYKNVEFFGDAFPVFYMRTTGVLGAFLGQDYKLSSEEGTVWFSNPEKELDEIAVMKLKRESPLYVRAMELTRQVQEHFQGRIAVGVPDFGGIYDVLSSIRDANELLIELCTDRESVMKAACNIYEQFKEAYQEFFRVIDPAGNPGYTSWATMLSQKPYYVLQNDFSAMIGPQMFDDYYKPILEKESRFIPRVFYHLDGPDAVKHLDSILTIDSIEGVQWVNGAGAPGLDQWPDIYKKITGAGKLCQVFINGAGELHYIDDIVEITGTERGLCFICSGAGEEKEQFEEYLKKYHVI